MTIRTKSRGAFLEGQSRNLQASYFSERPTTRVLFVTASRGVLVRRRTLLRATSELPLTLELGPGRASRRADVGIWGARGSASPKL